MRRLRFTIAGLLGVVPCVAVAVAALRAADDAWDSGLFGLTLLVLTTAVLLAVHRTGRRRAYWLGFALFGWIYLGASLMPPVAARLPSTQGLAYLDSKVPRPAVVVLGSWSTGTPAAPPPIQPTYYQQGNAVVSSQQGGSTATTWGFQVPPASTQGNGVPSWQQGSTVTLWGSPAIRRMGGPNGSTEDFLRIGHSLLALVLAFGGGHLSRWLHAG